MPDADRLVEKYLGGGGARPVGPLGLRLFNPGNLRPLAKGAWPGQVGVEQGFAVFATFLDGLRSLAENLIAYQDLHSICTVKGIIYRWAPPADKNNTPAYVAAVCKDTGFGEDDWLHLHEPTVLAELVKAIVHHEQGQQPFTEAEVLAAVALALA